MAAAVALLFFVSGAAVQAQVVGDIHVKVPFKFTVEDTTLPSGDYVISAPEPNDPKILEIRQEKGDLAVLFLTEDAAPTQKPVKTELVFDRIGGREFLSQVWVEGSDIGNQLTKSRTETKLEKAESKKETHRLTAQHNSRKS